MRYLIALVSMLFIFSGCEPKYTYASKDEAFKPSSEKEKLLSQRHLEYWDLFSSHAFEKAYAYEIPYERFLHTKKWYTMFNNNNIKAFQNKQLYFTKIRENVIDVRTTYISNTTNYSFHDRWFYVNKQWYHQMKTSILPKL